MTIVHYYFVICISRWLRDVVNILFFLPHIYVLSHLLLFNFFCMCLKLKKTHWERTEINATCIDYQNPIAEPQIYIVFMNLNLICLVWHIYQLWFGQVRASVCVIQKRKFKIRMGLQRHEGWWKTVQIASKIVVNMTDRQYSVRLKGTENIKQCVSEEPMGTWIFGNES